VKGFIVETMDKREIMQIRRRLKYFLKELLAPLVVASGGAGQRCMCKECFQLLKRKQFLPFPGIFPTVLARTR